MNKPLRIGFAGTPEFAAIILRALLSATFEVVVVYTQPDRRAGRGRRLQASQVKQLAAAHHLEIRQPASLRNEAAPRELAAFDLDVFVVAAYGLILPESLLSVPRQGCINVHASLLPRWRGAAPVVRAIMAGDQQTGISIMQMDAGLDTGPVLAQVSCPIGADTLGCDLEAELADTGASCLIDCLSQLDTLQAEPQSEAGASYAKKITPADAVIDWSRSAHHIDRQIRALYGRLSVATTVAHLKLTVLEAAWQPESASDGASTDVPGTILNVSRNGIQVACGAGQLILHRLQLNHAKGRPLSAADAINGYPKIFASGVHLGDPI